MIAGNPSSLQDSSISSTFGLSHAVVDRKMVPG